MSLGPLIRACIAKRAVSSLGASLIQVRAVSTSNMLSASGPSFKNILSKNDLSETEKKAIEADVKDTLKDWLPYGWDNNDKIKDIAKYKTGVFILVVIFTFGFAFQLWYRPRGIEGDWARREAFLELERRRKLGLPLVDPNLIPPERVKLPSQKELGPDFKPII